MRTDRVVSRWASSRVAASIVALAVTVSTPADAQQPAPHDHRMFACLPDGLRHGARAGCQVLAQPVIRQRPDTPAFWHLTTFRTRRDAEAARRDGEAVVRVAGRIWLSSIGGRNDTTTRGRHVASIGPLPMPQARVYRVELYHVIMPARSHTRVHVHPGPEAWYVLEGQQCLDTPAGVVTARAGEGSVAPPGGTPMQLTNNGAGPRRALFIVVHDSSQAWSTPSDWRPSGKCD